LAQRIQTLYVDDIDGSEADGTVRFGLDGAGYEIDLSEAHSEELHNALAPYIAHARRTTTRGPARGRRNASAADPHKVREWARQQGIQVKERGRVPAEIAEKYHQATGR
jgi:hypothetical protein